MNQPCNPTLTRGAKIDKATGLQLAAWQHHTETLVSVLLERQHKHPVWISRQVLLFIDWVESQFGTLSSPGGKRKHLSTGGTAPEHFPSNKCSSVHACFTTVSITLLLCLLLFFFFLNFHTYFFCSILTQRQRGRRTMLFHSHNDYNHSLNWTLILCTKSILVSSWRAQTAKPVGKQTKCGRKHFPWAITLSYSNNTLPLWVFHHQPPSKW